MLFGKKPPPTRSELIAAADRAKARGRIKKAIAGYRKALELEPNDPALHNKIAPLLARAKQPEAALQSFITAAKGYLDRGFADKAGAVYSQAADIFPLQVKLWQQVAQLNVTRGRRADAVKALLLGRTHFRRASLRPEAITLLKGALELDPSLFEPRMDLARQLAREGQKSEAMALLRPLIKTLKGRPLRQVRWTIACISPGLGTWWRWFRAALLGR